MVKISNNWSAKFALLIFATLVQNSAVAAEPVADTAEMVIARINEISKDPVKRQMAYEAGRERSTLCAHCHGPDGNSLRPDIPNLAAQNPPYIVEQISKFADGRRKNFVMQTLASSFTIEDKVNLAIYFSSQEVKPIAADPILASKAAMTFQTVCQLCHGEDGKGEKGYARIAGQKQQYVINTLQRFRAVAQGTIDENDAKRISSRMEQVTQRLSDQDIEALANYITLLH
jgi:cytochrome c553